MPGEHDAGLDFGTAYQEIFGPSRYAFEHKGVHFIVLDNVSDPRGLGDDQLAWLTSQLSTLTPTTRIVVFTHRPLFDLYPQWEWAMRDGDKAVALLMPFENVTVFYGHIHQGNHHMTGHIAHLGFYASTVDQNTPAGDLRYYAVIDVHKSFGFLVILAMAFRLVWRAGEPTPRLPASVSRWEKVLARTSQVLLYAALFLMPVTGWLWATAYGEPMRFFGIKLPVPVHLKGDQATLAHHIHIVTAFVLAAMVGLHVVGALKNHFVNRNDVLRKMIGQTPRVEGPE